MPRAARLWRSVAPASGKSSRREIRTTSARLMRDVIHGKSPGSARRVGSGATPARVHACVVRIVPPPRSARAARSKSSVSATRWSMRSMAGSTALAGSVRISAESSDSSVSNLRRSASVRWARRRWVRFARRPAIRALCTRSRMTPPAMYHLYRSHAVGVRNLTTLPAGSRRSSSPQRWSWRQSNRSAEALDSTTGMLAGVSPRRIRRPSSAAWRPCLSRL